MSSTSETPPLSREERFKALRSKLSSSQSANRQAVIAEHKRQRLDPALLSKLDRKKAEAEMKLAKADAEDAQEDFERKRAWDWTIEESEKWDLRMQEKQGNRESANFADYTQASEKNYRKNMKGFKPDLEGYRKAKEEALERGELVRREDGEVVAVGGEGAFYATRNSLGLVDHKPSKDAVDRLVEETKKRYVLLEGGLLMFLGKLRKKLIDGRRELAKMAILITLIRGIRSLIRSWPGFMIRILGRQGRLLKGEVLRKYYGGYGCTIGCCMPQVTALYQSSTG